MDLHDALRRHARAAAERAHAPFSPRTVGAALLLSDGTVVTGSRVESASYPLTIPALQAAWARMRAAGRSDLVAAATSRTLHDAERDFLAADSRRRWTRTDEDVAVVDGAPLHAVAGALRAFVDPPADPLLTALDAARHAHAPVSQFPVGCVMETEGGWVRGSNVEHAEDWTRGLCAERVALATAVAAGAGAVSRIWLACPKAPGATPCGGCRQLLAELAPDADLRMWNGDDPPIATTPAALLPGGFRAEHLG